MPDLQRREFIVQGSAALAGMVGLYASLAHAFPTRPDEEVIPWLDQPAENPNPVGIQTQLVWEDMDSWITPNDKFFSISHFNRPTIDEKTWSLEVGGLVRKPFKMSLAYIKDQPRQEVVFTVECSGNHGFPFFTGGIGNARWAGTPLAPFSSVPASLITASRLCSSVPTGATSQYATSRCNRTSLVACRSPTP